MRQTSLVVLALTALIAPALADGMSMPMTHSAARNDAERANAAATEGMMKGMNVPPTGNPDLDFARMMTAHHQGAIAMAQVELRYGKDPELRALARDIVAAQEKEIAQMKAWIAAHR